MLSGALVTMILYPLDTIKKTVQTNGGRGFLNSFTDTKDCLMKLPK